MLRSRVLTALVVLPLFLVALFALPRLVWGMAMLGIVLLACVEWGRLASFSLSGQIVFAAAVSLGCVVSVLGRHVWLGEILTALALMFWLGIAPRWLRAAPPVSARALAGVGFLILVTSWYALFALRESGGRLLALMAVVWIADTAAYFAGRRFGKHKLAPSISPGKTWEGVVGAGVGVSVYYAVLWLVWNPDFLGGGRLLDGAIVAAMTALSIEGDLFESWLKRRAGVKDSGMMLPGHGGVLDRIDGLVAALPFAALASFVGRG